MSIDPAILSTIYLSAETFEKNALFAAQQDNKVLIGLCTKRKAKGADKAEIDAKIMAIMAEILAEVHKTHEPKVFVLEVIEHWIPMGDTATTEAQLRLLLTRNIPKFEKKGPTVRNMWVTIIRSYLKYLHGESPVMKQDFDEMESRVISIIQPIEDKKPAALVAQREAALKKKIAIEKSAKSSEKRKAGIKVREAQGALERAKQAEADYDAKKEARGTHSGSAMEDMAHSGHYNKLDYRSLFDDSAAHYHDEKRVDYAYAQLHPYVDYSHPSSLNVDSFGDHYWSGLMVGGVFGGAAIVFVLLVFCIGLAFGMVTCWAYMQQRALEKGKNKEVYWKANDENDSNL